MRTYVRWLETPFPAKDVFKNLFLSTGLVFGVWLLAPLLIGNIHWAQFAVTLSARNIAVIVGQSFGEELVFRVFPILAILLLFPNRYNIALLASLIAAFYFGLWHPWAISANVCLGLGGVVLAVIYLKCGGAQGRPFQGLMACGGIHATCNVLLILGANLLMFFL